MKSFIKWLGIIALVAVIVFTFASCGDGGGGGGGGGGSGGSGNAGTYIITGSGTTFTATKNGATVGTANQSLMNVFSAVRVDANGADCTIQFGTGGSNVLDIDTGYISFVNNTVSNSTWGIVTLTGKIKSTYTGAGINATIFIGSNSAQNISVVSTADITCTTSPAIRILNGTTLTINSGTITSDSNTIYIYNGGTVNMTGGTVTKTGGGGYAVYKDSGGTFNKTGGTINGNTN
jgi:hypothetical protein